MKRILLVIAIIVGLISCGNDKAQQAAHNHNHQHSESCTHDHDHNHDHNHEGHDHDHDHNHEHATHNHDHNHEGHDHAHSQQPTAIATTMVKMLSLSQSTNKRKSILKSWK